MAVDAVGEILVEKVCAGIADRVQFIQVEGIQVIYRWLGIKLFQQQAQSRGFLVIIA